jgi:biopolymer transport protein ExbB
MRYILFVLLSLNAIAAQAWWQEDWNYRKQLTVDTTPAGGDIAGTLLNVPVLVRLHAGNFGYFLDTQPHGEDLRFIAADDKTPLKYQVESYDAVNEMALVRVQVPTLPGNATTPFWMYYGNATAVSGADPSGVYDADQALIYHFSSDAGVPVDGTANGINPALSTAQPESAGIIGGAVGFTGNESIEIAQNPALALDPEKGWTFSAWMKISQAQTGAVLFEGRDAAMALRITIDGTSLAAEFTDGSGATWQTPAGPLLTPGQWQHVALVVNKTALTLYLNGIQAATVDATIPAFSPAITVGRSAAGDAGFVGELDELGLSRAARSPDWIKLAASEGLTASLMVYGEDGQKDAAESGGVSYFAITMRNVTVDGWVVIVVLAMMAAVSWLVMTTKGLTLMRVRRDNALFLKHFETLGAQDVATLDTDEDEADEALRESPLLLALSGRHDHFQSSSLYRIYHSGVQQLEHRMPKAVGAQVSDTSLSPQAIDAIRATMDGALVRESQKLNSQMVLLTIAISGGPFLGLLGTVVGVMITFAAIAASGDVNVNAIAPGIAAALLATVAGLVVAIPSLFGYNYLGTRIKEITADMHVFVDEFVTRIAEQHR